MVDGGIAWITGLAFGSAALPALAVLSTGRRTTRPRLWIVAWSLALLASNLAAAQIGAVGARHVLLTGSYAPLTFGLAIWGVSLWQDRPIARRWYRATLLLGILVPLIVMFAPDPEAGWDLVGIPAVRLAGLAVSAHLLVTRSARALDPIQRQDWFWVSLGLCVYFAASVALQPLEAVQVHAGQPAFGAAWAATAIGDVLAFFLITVGVLCPLPPTRSGPSS